MRVRGSSCLGHEAFPTFCRHYQLNRVPSIAIKSGTRYSTPQTTDLTPFNRAHYSQVAKKLVWTDTVNCPKSQLVSNTRGIVPVCTLLSTSMTKSVNYTWEICVPGVSQEHMMALVGLGYKLCSLNRFTHEKLFLRQTPCLARWHFSW